MNAEQVGETTKIRRALAGLTHPKLASYDYIKSKIFITCETPNCASYVCNLSTGGIEESHGLEQVFGFSGKLRNVEQLNEVTHPDDLQEICRILAAISVLGEKAPITSEDRLTCTYRVKRKNKYIMVHRQSGLAVQNNTSSVLNWSNIYAMPAIKPLDKVMFNWNGSYVNHIQVVAFLNKEKTQLLTRRESEILAALMNWNGSEDICSSLHISSETLKKHLSNMFKKAGVKSRMGLLRFFERHRES